MLNTVTVCDIFKEANIEKKQVKNILHSTVSLTIFFEPIGILNFHWGDLFIYLIVDYTCLWFLFFFVKKVLDQNTTN